MPREAVDAGRGCRVMRVPPDAVDAVVRRNPALARRIGEQLDNRRTLADGAVASARDASGVIAIGDGTAAS